METAEPQNAVPREKLSLVDAISIIVGIIIGSSFYNSTPIIANCVPSVNWFVGVWLFGALLTVVGSLCYGELAYAYPRNGGDYIYLTEAFGRRVGFIFAWLQFWLVRPGSIGVMAYVFAEYAQRLWPLSYVRHPAVIYAALSVIVLSLVNLAGVHFGKHTQNVLSLLKYVGLALVVYFGFTKASPAAAEVAHRDLDLPTAMIFILFAYSGWNEIGYVAAEVRNPTRNVLRALLWSALLVMAIYLLAALAFVHALTLDGVRGSSAVAADVLQSSLGKHGGMVISGLICATALGAINGMLFTGARIYHAMGADHRIFSWLSHWNPRLHVPLRTLVIQAVVTLALVVGFGLSGGSFEKLVVFTGPAFWFFLFLVGVAPIVLRVRRPSARWLFPMEVSIALATVFCTTSAYMLYASVSYASGEQFHGDRILFWGANGFILVVGIVLSFV